MIITRSTNSGNTWSARTSLAIGSNRGQGVHITTGPNGEVYVAWAHYTTGVAEVGIGFAKSNNGGGNYSTPSVVFPVNGIRITNGGIPALNNTRAASFPYMDVDRSNGPRRGWIYIVVPELVNGQGDIFLRRSTDSGTSWSDRIQVNGPDVEQGKWQWMPSLAVDQTNGDVSITYFSMDSVGNNYMTNRYLSHSTDGGNTFTHEIINDSRFLWQPRNAPNTNVYYAGDYYETAAHGGKIWGTWSTRQTGAMQAYVENLPGPPIYVTVDQKPQGSQTSVDSIARWETNTFATYPTPQSFTFIVRKDEVLRGTQKLVSDYKYNNWNSLSDVTNHHVFGVTPQASHLLSSLFPTDPTITVKTDLLDATGTTGGNVQFKDPWLIDFPDAAYGNNVRNQGMDAPFKTRSSPFNPDYATSFNGDVYKGVFLDQGLPNWNPPYYSVGAPFENTINGHTAYFQNWSGSNVTYQTASQQQTPVVFTSSGAIASAQYKGKLLSSVSNPTGSNSQRVTAGIPYGTHGEELYALVYPSAGELWWNVSFDNGSTWWNEKRFTNSGATASAPSIALWTECVTSSPLNDPCETDLYAVYRKQSGGNYQIMFTIPPFPEAGISSSVQLNSTSISTNIDTRPVITRVDYFGGPWLYAFWEGTGGLWMNFAYPENGDWEWAGEDLRYSGYLSPSVSGVSDANFFLTYDNRQNVKIIDYVGSVDEVVPASVAPLSRSSQVSANTSNSPGEAHVVWEASNPQQEQQQRVMYQFWHDDKWEEAHEFVSNSPAVDFSRPTVSNLSSGNIVCAWDDGSSTYKAESAGEEWIVTEAYESLIHPNLVIAGSNGPLASTRIAGTDVTGPPYQLVFGTETNRAEKSTLSSVVSTQYSRRAVVARRPYHQKKPLREQTGSARLDPVLTDTSAFFSVEITAINLKLSNGTIVPLELTNETSPALNENSVWNRLSTSPLTLPANVDSVFVEGVAVMHGYSNLVNREIGLSFDVIDADNGTLIKRVNRERVYQSNGKGNLGLRDRLEGLHGRRVLLKPTVRGFAANNRNLVTTVVHVHTVLDESSRNQNLLTKQDHSLKSTIPTTFAVHANYPNPFNPSTTIKFELPENSSVSLVVYDVLGREVAQLVSGTREAGYHSATWDASNMSSGVYFARFTATDASGNVRLNKVSKLVLTK